MKLHSVGTFCCFRLHCSIQMKPWKKTTLCWTLPVSTAGEGCVDRTVDSSGHLYNYIHVRLNTFLRKKNHWQYGHKTRWKYLKKTPSASVSFVLYHLPIDHNCNIKSLILHLVNKTYHHLYTCSSNILLLFSAEAIRTSLLCV